MSKQGKYLFIRILEACNADCFMCDFAKSKDPYRFGVAELVGMLPRIKEEGVEYIRFTGGEPLLHKQIVPLVQAITDHGLKSSIITNGTILEKKAPELAQAGLSQVIVSIDGYGWKHDNIRGTLGLFKRCIAGLKAAQDHGILLRVNSVVGPQNYKDMPKLQDLFTEIGVAQWEMSSLKLNNGKLDYSEDDRKIIEEEIIPQIFEKGAAENKLVPFGKIWCGDTKAERDLYFETGITPRPDGECHVVDYVRYLDGRNGKLYACSLIPHRVESEKLHTVFVEAAQNLSTSSLDIQAQAAYFKTEGPKSCTGCSTTAAGFSNQARCGGIKNDWSY